MKRTTLISAGALLIAGPLVLTGCIGGTTDAPEQDESSAITVWVDDTRVAPAEAWAAANPEYDVNVEAVESTAGVAVQKISLAVKAGEGVPDAVFLGSADDLSTLMTNAVDYPLALDGVVSEETLSGFAAGQVDRCSTDGKAYCLPNDIAQTVLYYNKTLFDEFGYALPKTFDEFAALSEKVATEHPGYSLGSVAGRYGLDGWFGSSGCPVQDVTSPTELTFDSDIEECTRVAEVVGPMVANGTLTTLDFFDANYSSTIGEGKLLATIAPSWMGEYGIKPNYTTEGDFAVAPMPLWDGAESNYSSTVGGGIWVGYGDTKNQKAVAAFLEGVSSDPTYAGTGATYPADNDSADEWLGALADDAWYAEDPAGALKDAAGNIIPSGGYVRHYAQVADIFTNTVIANADGDIEKGLQEFGEQVKKAAEAAGYTVK